MRIRQPQSSASLVAKLTRRNRKRAILTAKNLVYCTAMTTGNDKGKGKEREREREPEAEPVAKKRPDTWPGHLQNGKWFCECNRRAICYTVNDVAKPNYGKKCMLPPIRLPSNAKYVNKFGLVQSPEITNAISSCGMRMTKRQGNGIQTMTRHLLHRRPRRQTKRYSKNPPKIWGIHGRNPSARGSHGRGRFQTRTKLADHRTGTSRLLNCQISKMSILQERPSR